MTVSRHEERKREQRRAARGHAESAMHGAALRQRAANGDATAVFERVEAERGEGNPHVLGMRCMELGLTVTLRALHPAEMMEVLDVLNLAWRRRRAGAL